jgi:hypothetical protein
MITHWIKDSTGKTYPVRHSNGVIMQLAVSEEIPSNQIQKFLSGFASWPIGRVYKFYYFMFKSGAKKENVAFDMTEEDFVEWINDDETVMPQVLNILSATSPDQKKTAKVQAVKK